MPSEHRENFFLELLKFIILALLIVVPVRLFVAQPFFVSGASMDPTFENGQYLIIDELTYRFRGPTRGDVVIFQAPTQPRGIYYIKRIVGLPGEVVHITNTGVSVTTAGGETITLEEPYVKNHSRDRAQSYTIPQGHYFVMGDNRPESSDSRVWGTLPREDIVGRAFVRLLPIQSFALLPGSARYAP